MVRTFIDSRISPELFELLQPRFTSTGAATARQTLHELEQAGSLRADHAEAIRNYRSGRYRSLDEAFRLVAPKRRRRGAPAKHSSRIDAGNQIENCLLRGESMADVADQLSDASPRGNGLDESHVRRRYREFRQLRQQFWSSPVMSADLTGRLMDLVGLPNRDADEVVPQPKRKSKTNNSNNSRSR